MWRIRCRFWNWLLVFKFRHAKPLQVPPPPATEQPLAPVPFREKFPGVPISGLVVADHVPKDEGRSQPLALPFCRLQALLNRVFPPMQAGLPPIDPDPNKALSVAYTEAHRRCYPAPRRPGAIANGIDLGRLALESPYSAYLETAGDGSYRWDLRMLEQFECHTGLMCPSALVEFSFDHSARTLRPLRIDCELGVVGPGDPQWEQAQRLALCAATTHLSLVRHFNWIHLVCGGPLAMVTRNCLPASHPVRRFLQPHVFGTQSSNEMVTLVQMETGGDFENIFSFTHAGMCELFEATRRSFDLRMGDPQADATRRNVAIVVQNSPAMENRTSLMKVIRDHVTRYLSLYYSDAEIAADEDFLNWAENLGVYVDNGLQHHAVPPKSVDEASTLLATLIYLMTVEHEIVGSSMWNYQLWSDAQPVRMNKSGERPPLDVYQRLVNANFNLNVRRTPLMTDFAYLALDKKGARAFRRFLDDLRALQAAMDRQPPACWKIEPQMLKANINA